MKWKIEREGRAWEGEEIIERLKLLPDPAIIEIHQGKLFKDDTERLVVAAMLLENIGVDAILPILDTDILFEALIIHDVGQEKFDELLKALDFVKNNNEKK